MKQMFETTQATYSAAEHSRQETNI